MKKRAFAAILAAVMCVSMAACGTQVEGTMQAVETVASVATETESTVESVVETEVETVAETVVETEEEFTIGTQNGLEYVSEFAGIKIAVPEDWTIATEEQLSQMNGWTENLQDSDLKTLIENSSIIYDYMSQAPTGASINVVCQSVNKLFGNTLFEDQIIQATVESLPEQYLQLGYDEVTECRADKMNIAGKERNVIVTEGSLQGIKVSQLQIFMLKGGYNWVATLTIFPEADPSVTMDDLTSYVQSIE